MSKNRACAVSARPSSSALMPSAAASAGVGVGLGLPDLCGCGRRSGGEWGVIGSGDRPIHAGPTGPRETRGSGFLSLDDRPAGSFCQRWLWAYQGRAGECPGTRTANMRSLLGDREAACETVIMRSATPDGTWEGFNPAEPHRNARKSGHQLLNSAASTARSCFDRVNSAKGGVVRPDPQVRDTSKWNDDKRRLAVYHAHLHQSFDQLMANQGDGVNTKLTGSPAARNYESRVLDTRLSRHDQSAWKSVASPLDCVLTESCPRLRPAGPVSRALRNMSRAACCFTELVNAHSSSDDVSSGGSSTTRRLLMRWRGGIPSSDDEPPLPSSSAPAAVAPVAAHHSTPRSGGSASHWR